MSDITTYEEGYMDAENSYLIVDPETFQISVDREYLIREVEKRFISLFGTEPERVFWCYGYDIACAGPIPTKKNYRNPNQPLI